MRHLHILHPTIGCVRWCLTNRAGIRADVTVGDVLDATMIMDCVRPGLGF